MLPGKKAGAPQFENAGFQINQIMKAAIGIDIGGTNVQVALIHQSGGVLTKKQLIVATVADEQPFLHALSDVVKDLLRYSPDLEVEGIGIGSPGANIEAGVIEKASNLPWKRLPIVDFLQEAFNLPVYLTNDANLFAIGEKNYGKASDMNDFAVVTLGTGVGAGIYSDGKLLLGRDGLAGEIGHVIVKYDEGRPCRCGRKGCLERYTSASGLVYTVHKFLNEIDEPSCLREIPKIKISAVTVAEAADKGDKIAQEVFRYTGNILGIALANYAAYMNPEAIFVAGGLSNAGDHLLEPTRKSFNDNILNIYPKPIDILFGSLPDDHAGVLGASALVWDIENHYKKIDSPLSKMI